jgi:hypothetical protein
MSYFAYQVLQYDADKTKFLDGFWEATPAFCKKAGLKTAQIYITILNQHDARVYFLLESDEAVLVNSSVDVDIRKELRLCCKNNINYTWTILDEIEPIPQELSAKLFIHDGMLGLYKDDILYMELYKNNSANSTTKAK